MIVLVIVSMTVLMICAELDDGVGDCADDYVDDCVAVLMISMNVLMILLMGALLY